MPLGSASQLVTTVTCATTLPMAEAAAAEPIAALSGAPALESAGSVAVAGQGSRTIRRNALALGTGQMFTWLMTLAWTLVVPRLLGAGGMGMIITGMAVVSMLQIALGAGTAVYVAREVVVAPEDAARTVVTASLLRLALVPLFGMALVVWAQLAHYAGGQDDVLYLCGAATAIMLLGEPLISYFQATERMHYVAIADSINKASQGLVGIVLAVIGFGAIGFAACWVFTAAAVGGLSVVWAKRYIHLRWRTTWDDIKHITRGSVSFWTGGLFFTIYLWIDTSMLSLMTNAKVVGWYGVPMRLWGSFFIFAAILSKVYFPRLVAAHERSYRELQRAARAPIELVLVISLPVATAIIVGAGPGLSLLYGAAYAQSVPVLVILGITLIPMCLNMILGTIGVAANRQAVWNWLMVGATVFNPTANAILIPLTQHQFGNGGIGAAIAMVLTEGLVATTAMVIFGRRILGASTVRRVARMAVACGGSGLVVHLLRSTGPVPSLLAGACALVALVLLLRAITPEEQRAILAFAERSVGRATALLARLRSRPVNGRLANEVGEPASLET